MIRMNLFGFEAGINVSMEGGACMKHLSLIKIIVGWCSPFFYINQATI